MVYVTSQDYDKLLHAENPYHFLAVSKTLLDRGLNPAAMTGGHGAPSLQQQAGRAYVRAKHASPLQQGNILSCFIPLQTI